MRGQKNALNGAVLPRTASQKISSLPERQYLSIPDALPDPSGNVFSMSQSAPPGRVAGSSRTAQFDAQINPITDLSLKDTLSSKDICKLYIREINN